MTRTEKEISITMADAKWQTLRQVAGIAARFFALTSTERNTLHEFEGLLSSDRPRVATNYEARPLPDRGESPPEYSGLRNF